MTLDELLAFSKRQNASDLLFSPGMPVGMRVNGRIRPVKMDPLESIFRGVLAKHLEEMSSLKSIIRDAVADPSKPKSALDAL